MKAIYSREFLAKTYAMKPAHQKMIFDAVEHVLQDPNHHDYERPYLTPYKQKHPTSDHQYTLYFLILSVTEVYFIWVNDHTCLHTTRANYDDPCTKEFLRRRDKKLLQDYDPLLHNPDFKVHPKNHLPLKCRSRYLGFEINLNSYQDGNDFIGTAISYDDPHNEIILRHMKSFLSDVHAHVKKEKFNYRIEIMILGQEEIVDVLRASFEPKQWKESSDKESFIIEVI